MLMNVELSVCRINRTLTCVMCGAELLFLDWLTLTSPALQISAYKMFSTELCQWSHDKITFCTVSNVL